MMSKWRPRRSTDDERRSSLCKPKAPGIGGFAVNVSADAGSYHRAPALPTPLAVPARRPSLLGRLGCEAPARQPSAPLGYIPSSSLGLLIMHRCAMLTCAVTACSGRLSCFHRMLYAESDVCAGSAHVLRA